MDSPGGPPSVLLNGATNTDVDSASASDVDIHGIHASWEYEISYPG